MAANKKKGTCKYEGCKGCNKETCPGKTSDCAAYRRARSNAYVKKHAEEVYERNKAKRESNPEETAKYNREYHKLNKERITKVNKAYVSRNKEKIAAYHKQYFNDHLATGDIKALMHEDGSITRMRSMSEVYFFSMLEEEGVVYEYEVRLETPMGVYVADGYLPEFNIYVEVKADYYVRDDQMAKINYLRENGYSIIMIDSNLIDGEFGF